MNNAGKSNYNLFHDRLLSVRPRLKQAEWLLAIAIGRNTLGYYCVERELGEDLLRGASGLDGRSFTRARDGLIEKGLIVYTPASGRGRGHRSRYRLVLGDGDVERAGAPAGEWDIDSLEAPAPERDFDQPQTPAPERENRQETPAQTPAQTPAPERGRIEEGVKNDDDGELTDLLWNIGPVGEAQQHLFEEAFRANAAGFKACVAEARRGNRPGALLTSMVRNDAHLRAGSSNAKRSRLEAWLAGEGRRFEDESAREILVDSFGLAGAALEDALRRRRDFGSPSSHDTAGQVARRAGQA